MLRFYRNQDGGDLSGGGGVPVSMDDDLNNMISESFGDRVKDATAADNGNGDTGDNGNGANNGGTGGAPAAGTEPAKTEPAPAAKTDDEARKQPPAPIAVDFDKQLSERFGGKFKTAAELEAHLNQPRYKSPAGEKIDEYLAKDGKLEDFIKAEKIGDIEKMSHADAVRQNLQRQGDFTSAQIDAYMDQTYPSDPATRTQSEIDAAQVRLTRDATTAKQELQAWKEKLLIPSQDEARRAETERVQTAQAEAKQRQEQWTQDVAKEIQDFGKIAIPFDKDEAGRDVEPFELVVTPEEQAAIKDAATKLRDGEFWAGISKDAKGNFDIQKLFRNLYFAANGEKVRYELSKAGFDRGVLSLRARLSNTSDDFGGGPADTGGAKSYEDQVADAYAGSIAKHGG